MILSELVADLNGVSALLFEQTGAPERIESVAIYKKKDSVVAATMDDVSTEQACREKSKH